MSSTAYNDPTMCFVVDFYDPSAIFYNKHINIFGDDLPNVSAIDPDKIFKVDEQFKDFIWINSRNIWQVISKYIDMLVIKNRTWIVKIHNEAHCRIIVSS